MLFTLSYFILGFLLLIQGASYLIDGATGIAKKFMLPHVLIGLTLVALGTSAPEITISTIAGIEGAGHVVLGNVIGSNIANIALILGCVGIMGGMTIRSRTLIKYDIPFVLLTSLVLFILTYDRYFENVAQMPDGLSRGDGIILLVLFLIFLRYIFSHLHSTHSLSEELSESEKKLMRATPTWLITMTIAGCIMLVLGGKIVVDMSIQLAEELHVSQTLIGLTIMSIGTSLPEVVTTIMAVKKGRADVAIGNIIGSNIINILLILGIISLFSPLTLPSLLYEDIIFMSLLSFILYLYVRVRKSIDVPLGIILLLSYALYLYLLFVRESGL